MNTSTAINHQRRRYRRIHCIAWPCPGDPHCIRLSMIARYRVGAKVYHIELGGAL